jgi:hypothetical protein
MNEQTKDANQINQETTGKEKGNKEEGCQEISFLTWTSCSKFLFGPFLTYPQ